MCARHPRTANPPCRLGTSPPRGYSAAQVGRSFPSVHIFGENIPLPVADHAETALLARAVGGQYLSAAAVGGLHLTRLFSTRLTGGVVTPAAETHSLAQEEDPPDKVSTIAGR